VAKPPVHVTISYKGTIDSTGCNKKYQKTSCAVDFSNQNKIPKSLSIFLGKVVIEDLESAGKIITQQCLLGVTS